MSPFQNDLSLSIYKWSWKMLANFFLTDNDMHCVLEGTLHWHGHSEAQ